MATSAELQAQIEKLQTELEIKRKEELSTAIAQIKELMSKNGITLEDLGAGIKKTRKTSQVKVKYRDPDNGDEWSGRGQPPKWMKAKLDAGKQKSDFLI